MQALTRVSLHVILMFDLVYGSRLWRLAISPYTQPLLLGTCAALVAVFSAVAIYRMYIRQFLLLLTIFSILAVQMSHFADHYLIPIQVNTGFQYGWILTFIYFYCAFRDGLREEILKAIVKYATVYSCVYTVMAAANLAFPLVRSSLAAMTISDMERGARLYAHPGLLSISWFYWLVVSKARRLTIAETVILLICALAIMLTLSRVYIALVALISVLFVLGFSQKTIGKFAAMSFVALTIQNLMGIFDQSLNPYLMFGSDSSGSFRIYEYEIARQVLLAEPFSGFGIAPTPGIAGHFIGNDYFSGSDIGAVGVWFDWGLVGLFLFIVGTIRLFIAPNYATRPMDHHDGGLFLTGCTFGIYGVLAPVITTSAATYFGVILAARMIRGHEERWSRVVLE